MIIFKTGNLFMLLVKSFSIRFRQSFFDAYYTESMLLCPLLLINLLLRMKS